MAGSPGQLQSLAMLEEPKRPDWIKSHDPQDALAQSIRMGLSIVPLGGILAEFLTQFVPGQRMDRLQEYVEILAEVVADVQEFHRRLSTSPGFAAVTEQAAVAAAQAPSSQRRRELAELIKSGLSRPESEMIEHEALLRLLGELNDAQVLILVSYGNFRHRLNDKEYMAFIETYPNVFVRQPHSLSDPERLRLWTMFQHYEAGLISSGLLRDTEGIVKSGVQRHLAITQLGRLLLDAIGRTAGDAAA